MQMTKVPPAQRAAENRAQRLARSTGRKPQIRHVVFRVCRAKEIRKRLGLTTYDVARDLELSHGTIANIELGFDTLFGTAKKLAAYYGVGIADIWPD